MLLFFAAQWFSAPALETELQFIAGLTEAGFPALAQKVFDRTRKNSSAAEHFAPELQIRILIAGKKFDAAQNQIPALENPAPLWLFLADTALRANQSAIAEGAYKNYFAAKPALDEKFLQAALHYHRRDIYETALDRSTDDRALRPVKANLAALLIEDETPENLERAKKLCEEVQLGSLDLWFGQSVVTWNRIMQRRGEWHESTAILETQLELLYQLEQNLARQNQPVEQISPLAGARYLLGLGYEHAGEHVAALTQFYNVYARYGGSEWGPPAQEKSQRLIAHFERAGKRVEIDHGVSAGKIEENAFRIARRLFCEKNYAAALTEYCTALNQYPECAGAVAALRELLICQIHTADSAGAKAVAAYTAERFAETSAAPDALLAAGKTALDGNQNELAFWIYKHYLLRFPAHNRAAGVLFSLASLLRTAGDLSGAENCLKKILRDYRDSAFYIPALGRLAWNAFEKEEWNTAGKFFAPYISGETDLQQNTRARFAFAECCRQSGEWERALEQYRTLEAALAATEKNYGVTEETVRFNLPFLEKSIFYQGICCAKLENFSAAVSELNRFIANFPVSEFILQAHFAKGTAQLNLKEYSGALTAFAVFNADSERRFLEPVLFYRAQAHFETGEFLPAVQRIDELFARWPESAFFFDAGILQGRAFTAVQQTGDAIRILSEVLGVATDDLIIHRATLELARAQTGAAEKLASLQRVALLADPAQHADFIIPALTESLPLYLELNRPHDLLADADRLLTEFSDRINTDEIQRWKNRTAEMLTADIADGER
ncbi:MAG: tetratricopeptide repeat protein [Kiritimatiellales bacterium]